MDNSCSYASRTPLLTHLPVTPIEPKNLALPRQRSFARLRKVNELAGIAQLVEQGTENPRVPSSNLGLGINTANPLNPLEADVFQGILYIS